MMAWTGANVTTREGGVVPRIYSGMVWLLLRAAPQLAEAPAPYSGGGIPKGGVMIVVLALLYVLPSMLAWTRRSRRRWKITAVNVLLGWTVLGWIVAMVMTYAYEPPPDGEVDVPHHPTA